MKDTPSFVELYLHTTMIRQQPDLDNTKQDVVLLVLHGSLFSSASFTTLAKSLDCKTEIIDLLNVLTNAPDLSYEELFEYVENWVNKNKKRRTILLGTGIGNKIAFSLSLRSPEKYDNLVLTGPVLENADRWLEMAKAQLLKAMENDSPTLIVDDIFSDIISYTRNVSVDQRLNRGLAQAYFKSITYRVEYSLEELTMNSVPNHLFTSEERSSTQREIMENFASIVGTNRGLYSVHGVSNEQSLVKNKWFLNKVKEIISLSENPYRKTPFFVNRLLGRLSDSDAVPVKLTKERG